MSADRYQKARVLMRDEMIYVFEIVREARSADLIGPCRAKLDLGIASSKLGGEVQQALQAYGREVTTEEIRAMGSTIAAATGHADARERNRGLGSVGLVYADVDGEYMYELEAWKTKGASSFPMDETQVRLPRTVSAADLGKEVLRLLEVSCQQNTKKTRG